MHVERDIEADLDLFITILHERRAWTLADVVAHDAHSRRPDSIRWHKRYVATLAEHAAGRVLGSSQGYKLQDHATDEEVREASARITDMITALQKRATEINRHFHGRMHAAEEKRRQAQEPQLNLL